MTLVLEETQDLPSTELADKTSDAHMDMLLRYLQRCWANGERRTCVDEFINPKCTF